MFRLRYNEISHLLPHTPCMCCMGHFYNGEPERSYSFFAKKKQITVVIFFVVSLINCEISVKYVLTSIALDSIA